MSINQPEEVIDKEILASDVLSNTDVDYEKLSPEKELQLVKEAEEFKDNGNELFKNKKDYSSAIIEYKKALETCPNYLSEKIAIYYGNISACYFNLKQYQETVDTCTKALEKDPNHIKARLRRATANEKLNTWASLESSVEDLKLILKRDEINESIRKTTIAQLREVEPKLDERKKAEAQELLGKLKTMGNGLLQNFGLSLDNFNFQQNDTGGYQANFKQ